MKLIKDLGTRFINGTWVRYGTFLCPYCHKEVVRRLGKGKSAKSCGCIPNNYKHGYPPRKIIQCLV